MLKTVTNAIFWWLLENNIRTLKWHLEVFSYLIPVTCSSFCTPSCFLYSAPSRAALLSLPNALTLCNSVPHVVVTPTIKLHCGSLISVISLLLWIVNIQYAGYLTCEPCKRVIRPPKGIVTYRLRIAAPESYSSPSSLPDAHFIHTPSSTHRVLCQKCLQPLCYWPDNSLYIFKT